MSEYRTELPDSEVRPLEKEVVQAGELLHLIEVKLKALPKDSPEKAAVQAEFERQREKFLSLTTFLRDMNIYRKGLDEEDSNS